MPEPADPRPRALLVTRNFPPLLGGMEKVNQQLLAALAREWSTGLAGPAGCAAHAPPGTVVAQTALKPLPWFLLGTLARLLGLVLRRRPRLVIAGSGLTAPLAWIGARLSGAQAVAYLHGLDIVAPSWLYQHAWLPFIRRCDLCIVNSRHTAELARSRGVPAQRIAVLNPGTELPPPRDPAVARAWRERHEVQARPLLLSVGRLTLRKGLAEFVASSLPALAARHPRLLLLVIGDEASNALHGSRGSERERILAAARAAGVEASLRFLGVCEQAELDAAYQAADCHVFPVLALPGDVEGFGMVALESAAHGLPTVAFSVGGVPDAVLEGASGTLVASGDYAGFADAVSGWLARPPDLARAARCRDFAADKHWDRFAERLLALLRAARG